MGKSMSVLMSWLFSFLLLSVCLMPGSVWAVLPNDLVEGSLRSLVLPVLTERCFDCHDADSAKGDVNLDILNGHGDERFDVRLWDKVREQLRNGTMPPKNKPQPTPEQRETILKWIRENEKAVLKTPPRDPGTRKVRRLTRHEYNNTLHDLLGVSVKPGDDFPADGAGGEGFDNNADTLILSPLLIEKYISGADAALNEVFAKPDLKQRWFKVLPGPNLPAEKGAELILRGFLPKAWRRPIGDEELKPLLAAFSESVRRGAKFDDAVKLTMKAALTTPKFLMLQEHGHPAGKSPQPVDDFSLASRLSYLLWSSMPDDQLSQVAAANQLHEDAVLEAQAKRLLADGRGQEFTRHFAGAWFRFEELFNSVEPDRRKFPAFNDALRQSMYDEALTFADNVLRHNGRLLDFLDSDYTYANEALAKLYGIPGVQGKDLRRVSFPDHHRGGLLGMAAILTATSYPQRTSPVLRGKWVLEEILGTPPPPPPPNVPKLPEDDRKLNEVTLRQRLEKHRSQPVCAGCHARLDPPGFALENFDSIGQWRDTENGKPIDANGITPDGRSFHGAEEFRKLLVQDKDKFIRVFCSRLLGYALNRGLEVHDQPTLLRLEETLTKNDYHCEPVIVALVKSYPFRWRK
jgi:PAS domain-containing protein